MSSIKNQLSPLDGVYPTKAINEIILNKYRQPIIKVLESFNLEPTEYLERLVHGLYYYIERVKAAQDPVKLFTGLNQLINNKFQKFTDEEYRDNVIFINDLRVIIESIKAEYIGYNYEYDYFMFYEKNAYLYNINKLNVNFDINTFVTGTINKDFSKEVITEYAFIQGLDISGIYRHPYLLHDLKKDKKKFYTVPTGRIGWSKQKILDALIQNNLFHEVITPEIRMYTYDGGRIREEIRYRRNYPELEKLGLIYRHDVYETYLTDENHDEHPVGIRLEGNLTQKDTPHLLLGRLPRYVLEQFYYYVYKPRLNINILPEIQYMDVNTARRMMHEYFPVSIDVNVLMNYQLKDIFDIISRNITMREFHQEIPELSQALILQPGGRTYSKYMQQPELFQKGPEVQVPQEYRRYLLNCQDVNIGFETIIFDAIELGLTSQLRRGMSRTDVCNIIRNYLQIHIEKY